MVLLTVFGMAIPTCFVRAGNGNRLTTLEGGVFCLVLVESPSSPTCFTGPVGGMPSCLGLVFGEESITGNCKNKSLGNKKLLNLPE